MIHRHGRPAESLSLSPWPVVRLANLCSKIGSGATPKGGSEVYVTSGYNFIRSQNVFDHRFSPKGLAFLDEQTLCQLSGPIVQKNDILLNITGEGETIARCCVANERYLPARVNQHVLVIRVNSHALPRFIQCYLSLPSTRAHLLAQANGGSRRALTKSLVESLAVPLPGLSTQQRIVDAIQSLDDKIEVNEGIGNTSMDLARELFAQELTGQPDQARLGDMVRLSYGKALKQPDRRKGKVPVFGCTGQVDWHDTPLAPTPSSVVGRKGANAGWVSWAPRPAWVIDTAFYSCPIQQWLSPEVAFLLLENANLKALVGDSAVPGLNRDMALKQVVNVPTAEAAVTLTTFVRPLMARADQAAAESMVLAELRDTLLPELMSGRLRVRDAEHLVEDAT